MDAFVERMSIGPSAGVPLAVKDCIDVAGFATRLGSRALAQAAPAARNAAVVSALLDGGYHLVGKTHMHEFAYGVTGVDSAGEGPRNPVFPDRIPGGSSSGSAVAVASREAAVALGTDTGGSVRVPAACCGVFGVKPTFGRLSREGVAPSASSLDCVGVLARSARVLAAAMAALDRDFHLQGCDIGKVARLRVSAEPLVQTAIDRALRQAPLEVSDAVLPGFDAAYQAGLKLIAAEAWQAFGRYAEDPRVGRDVAERLRAAASVSAADVAEAERIRATFTAEVERLLDTVDAIVLPTLPSLPPKRAEVGEARNVVAITALVRPFNLSGHPALTIPLRTAAAAPAGLQVVGRKGQDARLCGLAEMLEQTIPSVITDIGEDA